MWTRAKAFNLFDSRSNDPLEEKQERYTTRLYIVLLILTFAFLVFYTSFTDQLNTYKVQKPSEYTYRKLLERYSETVQCPCQTVSMAYAKFVSITWSYHQICSSQFISTGFSNQFAFTKNNTPLYRGDFMLMSQSYFQLMQTFCSISFLVILQQHREYRATLFVNAYLLSPNRFTTQIEQSVNSFIGTTTRAFAVGLEKLIILTTSNQLLSASYIGFDVQVTDVVRIQPSSFLGCSCLLHSDECSVPSAFYSSDEGASSFTQLEIVSGVQLACLPLLSFLKSSLVCWYSQQCYQMVRRCSIEILEKVCYS